jgi:hypothetical protein
MSPDETPQGQESPRRRRGRPPGSKSTTTGRSGRKRLDGGELVGQLNNMVAELIKENRKLRRQVVKLTERGSAAATTTVERGLRTISRRVQRALGGTAKKKRRTTAAPANGRRKATTRKRRKAS